MWFHRALRLSCAAYLGSVVATPPLVYGLIRNQINQSKVSTHQPRYYHRYRFRWFCRGSQTLAFARLPYLPRAAPVRAPDNHTFQLGNLEFARLLLPMRLPGILPPLQSLKMCTCGKGQTDLDSQLRRPFSSPPLRATARLPVLRI